MKYFSNCESCKQDSFIIKKRHYIIRETNTPIVSQSLLCGECYRGIKKLVNSKSPNKLVNWIEEKFSLLKSHLN